MGDGGGGPLPGLLAPVGRVPAGRLTPAAPVNHCWAPWRQREAASEGGDAARKRRHALLEPSCGRSPAVLSAPPPPPAHPNRLSAPLHGLVQALAARELRAGASARPNAPARRPHTRPGSPRPRATHQGAATSRARAMRLHGAREAASRTAALPTLALLLAAVGAARAGVQGGCLARSASFAVHFFYAAGGPACCSSAAAAHVAPPGSLFPRAAVCPSPTSGVLAVHNAYRAAHRCGGCQAAAAGGRRQAAGGGLRSRHGDAAAAPTQTACAAHAG